MCFSERALAPFEVPWTCAFSVSMAVYDGYIILQKVMNGLILIVPSLEGGKIEMGHHIFASELIKLLCWCLMKGGKKLQSFQNMEEILLVFIHKL